VCGASRRSREKRQGRNESRIGKPGPKARNEAAAARKAKAGSDACPVRWAPPGRGTAASWERTHTSEVDGGAIFETNPMRGVRQGSSRLERGRPRSHAAEARTPSGGLSKRTAPKASWSRVGQGGPSRPASSPRAAIRKDGRRKAHPEGNARKGGTDQVSPQGRRAQEQVAPHDAMPSARISVRAGDAAGRTGHPSRRTARRPTAAPSGAARGAARGLTPEGGSDVSSRERPRPRGVQTPGHLTRTHRLVEPRRPARP